MRTIRVMKIPGSEFSSVNWMLRSNSARSEFCCTTTTRPKTALDSIRIVFNIHQYSKSAARLISRPTQTVLAILRRPSPAAA